MKISARHPPRSPSEPMGHPPTFRPDHLPSRSPRSASRPHRLPCQPPFAPIGQPASSPASPPRPAALHAQLPHRLPRQPPSAPIARQGRDPQHVPLPCSPKRRGRILQRELLPRSPKRRGLSSAERWQDLRPMRDSRGLDTKRSPPWQDSRAMYPKSPEYTPKRPHGTKILPSSARKACISRERGRGGDLFCAIGEKRIHTARFLPHQPKQP